MARTALQKVYADFRQGFVTVANPLAYPEGALKDIVNFDIQDNGTLKLRAGLRQETADLAPLGITVEELNNLALSVHIWDNVRNSGDERIAAVQVGTTLHLFDMKREGIDVANKLGTIDLDIPSEGQGIDISTASGAGWLFIAHPDIRPKIIKRIGDTSFSKRTINIKIRDLSVWEGADDQQTGLERTNKLYPQHAYNLENGGWPGSAIVAKDENPDLGTITANPVDYTNEKLGHYPPIYVPFVAGRTGGGDTLNEQNAYGPWAIENDYFGKTPIPVGANIINADFWIRTGVGSTTSLLNPANPLSYILTKTYRWTQNPSSIEFYSGRVWYSGAKGYQETTSGNLESFVEDDNLDVSNTIYFSQQFDSELDKVERCYQENDPTGEDINQLLATDGGTLSIRGAGEILDIKTFGTSLLVFSNQGIWAVSGIDANSFKADGFSVNKISNLGPTTKNTIAATNNTIYYIANDAIYILTTDEVTGLPVPKDITSGKIKDFYTSIPIAEKERAKGLFDTSNRTFYMFYSDGLDVDDSVRNLYYNKVLVFNQDLGAFYKYDLTINSKYIVDGLFYYKDQVVNIQEPITIDGVPVTLDGEAVVLESTYSTDALNSLQLLTVVDNGTANLTFSSFTDISDFKDFDQDYSGKVEFGFDTAGDIMRDSYKAPVLISHMERTEDGFEINPNDPNNQELILASRSGCLLSYGWDWATNYKNPMQIYRFHRNYVPSGTDDPFNYGVDVITTRNRIRGKGHSLGIRLDSEAGKDCRILGIGILYTAARDI